MDSNLDHLNNLGRLAKHSVQIAVKLKVKLAPTTLQKRATVTHLLPNSSEESSTLRLDFDFDLVLVKRHQGPRGKKRHVVVEFLLSRRPIHDMHNLFGCLSRN